MADAPVLDLEKYPTAKAFVAKCHEFFREVKNLYDVSIPHLLMPEAPTLPPPEHKLTKPRTPGSSLESRLNAQHGPGTPYYDSFRDSILQGLSEGWVAQTELDGAKYRRGRIAPPTSESNYISITTVYMESLDEYRGQYHAHPYGEINCVIPLDGQDDAELKGMQGWQRAGWTSPGPGTHHYPEVRGGALVALFFLPAGRISYEASPGMPQPVSL